MIRPSLIALVFAALLLAQGLSYGVCVQDDAFISFRYGLHLLEGKGLVYNAGEAVEGYTNFSWTVLVAGAMALGANPVLAAVWGGLAAAAGLVWLSWRLADRLTGGAAPWLALLAPAALALDAGFALEAVQGLETAFFALLVTAGLMASLAEAEQPARWPLSSLILGLAALTRPEGVLVFGLLEGARLLRGRPGRRQLLGWAIFAGIVGAHLAFRLSFYGDWVPNTFHAKVGAGAAQLGRGLRYLLAFAQGHLAIAALGALGAGLALRRPAARAAALLCLVYLAYVVAVGGDFKVTARFIQPVLAPLAALAALALQRLTAGRGRALAVALPLLTVGAIGVQAATAYPRAQAEAVWRADDMDRRLRVGTCLRDHVPPDTLLAIHSAGTVPFASRLPTIDLWGLSDAHIARAPVPDLGAGMAGHERRDYPYAFGRRPGLYLPEEHLLTPEPRRLPVPVDFPADFEDNYEQVSIHIDQDWLNLFKRRDLPLGS